MGRIFVTGLGFTTSIGNDKPAVAESLRQMRSGIEHCPAIAEAPGSPVKVLGTLKGFQTNSFDPEDWIYPDNYKIRRDVLRGMSPHVLFAYCSMVQAIEDAGLTPEAIAHDNATGLFTGSAGSAIFTYEQIRRMSDLGANRVSPLGVVASSVGTLSYNLVAGFKITGSSCGFASACATSGHALGFAYNELQAGRQKRIFVVGAEDNNHQTILGFTAMRALSTNPDPACASRPFDAGRDGFVGTGGAAVVLLETEEAAAERGATPYAEFLGWGQASDGYNVAISHPEGDGLARAMELALASSGKTAADVSYVNAHATSTPIGDVSEIRALKRVFGNQGGPAISSTKALTGHGLSLASAMEAGFTVLGMREGFTPGSANISELDKEAEGLNIIRETRPEAPQVALSNSSGFGGANVCLCFGQV